MSMKASFAGEDDAELFGGHAVGVALVVLEPATVGDDRGGEGLYRVAQRTGLRRGRVTGRPVSTSGSGVWAWWTPRRRSEVTCSPRTRRSRRRTVETGPCSLAAMLRAPRPAALAISTAPMTAAVSPKRGRQPAGSST